MSKVAIGARGKESSLRNSRILKRCLICAKLVVFWGFFGFFLFFFWVVIEMCQPVSLTDELTKQMAVQDESGFNEDVYT